MQFTFFRPEGVVVGRSDHMKLELLRYRGWQKFSREQIINQRRKKKSNCPGVFFKHEFETWDVIMAFRSLLNRDWLRMFPRPIPQVCVEILHFSINISELVWLRWFFKRALYLVIYQYECVFVNNDKKG